MSNVSTILLRAAALSARKSQDYGDPDPARESYHPYGAVSYLQMIQTKVKRLESLLLEGREPKFEGAFDSVLDAINYLDFLGHWLEKRQAEAKRADDAAAHDAFVKESDLGRSWGDEE